MSHDGGGFSRAPSSAGGSALDRAESAAREWDNTWSDRDTGEISEAKLVLEGDASGKMEVVHMLRKVMYGDEVDLDLLEEEADLSGRYQYLLECRRTSTRPSLPALMQLSSAMLLLPHFGILPGDCGPLAAGIYCNESLTHINISDNNVGEDAAVYFARAVAAHSSIREVRMRGVGAGERGAEAWAATLQLSLSLSTLDMTGNYIGDHGGAAVVRGVTKSGSLQTLNLSDNQLAIRTAGALAHTLAHDHAPSFTSLDISWNHLRPADSRDVLKALASNATLKTLSLAWNGIGSAPREHRGDPPAAGKGGTSPQQPKSPQNKSPRSPGGGGEGGGSGLAGESLVHLLKTNKTLTDLDVSNCRLGESICRDLAKALRDSPTLQFVQLDGNRLKDEAAHILRELKERMVSGTLQKFSMARVAFDASRLVLDFDPNNPTGHYILDLADPKQRAVCLAMVAESISRGEDIIRNERLNGSRTSLSLEMLKEGWTPPDTGTFEADVIAMNDFQHKALSETMDSDNYRLLARLIEVSVDESAQIHMLRQACQSYFLDLSQAMLLLFKFSRDSSREAALVSMLPSIVDRRNIAMVLMALSPSSKLEMHHKVGPLHMINYADPAGKYWFDLGKASDRKALRVLTAIKRQDNTSTFEEVRYAAQPNLKPASVRPGTEIWKELFAARPTGSLAGPPGLIIGKTAGILELSYKCTGLKDNTFQMALADAVDNIRDKRRGSRESISFQSAPSSPETRSRIGSVVGAPAAFSPTKHASPRKADMHRHDSSDTLVKPYSPAPTPANTASPTKVSWKDEAADSRWLDAGNGKGDGAFLRKPDQATTL